MDNQKKFARRVALVGSTAFYLVLMYLVFQPSRPELGMLAIGFFPAATAARNMVMGIIHPLQAAAGFAVVLFGTAAVFVTGHLAFIFTGWLALPLLFSPFLVIEPEKPRGLWWGLGCWLASLVAGPLAVWAFFEQAWQWSAILALVSFTFFEFGFLILGGGRDPESIDVTRQIVRGALYASMLLGFSAWVFFDLEIALYTVGWTFASCFLSLHRVWRAARGDQRGLMETVRGANAGADR